jgi:hypothetical protein
VKSWNLESEEVIYKKSDPADNLKLNGATDDEIKFLRGQPHGKGFRGRRVELNAFTSDQFVEWLERKLKEHGIAKVVPDQATLEIAYRRAAGIARCQDILDKAISEVDSYTAGLTIPKKLRTLLNKKLVASPTMAWDDALESFLPDED